MHRIDTPGHSGNLFQDKDPVAGIPGTIVDDEWLNSVQEELVKLVEQAGETLNKADRNQVVGVVPLIIPTVAALKAVSAPAKRVAVMLLGYYAIGDRGGGLFYWDAASNLSDDGGSVIQPNSAPATGRWKRAFDDRFVFEWFGAKVDDDTVDHAPILNAVCSAMKREKLRRLYLAHSGRYYFNSRPNAFDFGIRIIGQQPRSFLVRNYTESNAYSALDPTTLGDASFMRWNGGAYAELGNDTGHPKGGGLENVGLMAPNGTSGGVAIGMYGSDDNNRAAFLDLKNVTVTGEGTGEWDRGWIVDGGNLTTAGTPGIRNVSFEAAYIWRCRTTHVRFRNAVHLSGHLLSLNDGGLGVTPELSINGTGTANGDSESVHIHGLDCYGNVTMVNCTDVHIYGRCSGFSNASSVTNSTYHGFIANAFTNNSASMKFYLTTGVV